MDHLRSEPWPQPTCSHLYGALQVRGPGQRISEARGSQREEDRTCRHLKTDAETGKLVQAGKPAQAREGAGPRHVAFHPAGQLAYVVDELDSTVTAYRFDPADGALQPFQMLSAVPDAFTGNSRAAEIAVSTDGRFVYASNRGNDSIAVFAMDPTTGRLSPASWMPSGGKTPRFFALGPSDTFLFAANEDSDTLIAFRRDAANGALSATSEVVRVGSPVCILFRIA
ncbi:lactonase family protein [Bradyrhizobium sp. CCBAU 11357]|uniref:lactonase family protein n=1 Tax=Bradyrhizobium sp. CCBAU 11357 TaxID=1630808 RepID=UPI0023021277|nr:beta-propeller fold lactonase family protein [Bradyrhizobium sp. CCBAU 11357]